MNLNPARSTLRHSRDYICLPCLLSICYTPRWQQPVRNYGSQIVVPKLSPSVAASLHDTIDRADRTKSPKQETNQKSSNAQSNEPRPENPGPPSPSPASSKKPLTFQETPSEPVIASPKAIPTYHKSRTEKFHKNPVKALELLIQGGILELQDASSKGKASKQGSSALNAKLKWEGDPVTTGVDSVVPEEPSKPLGNLSTGSRMRTPGEGRLRVGGRKRGAVGASSTGSIEKGVESMESRSQAQPLSRTTPRNRVLTIFQTLLNDTRGRKPKVLSEKPAQSPPAIRDKPLVAATVSVRRVRAAELGIVRRVDAKIKSRRVTSRVSVLRRVTAQAMVVRHVVHPQPKVLQLVGEARSEKTGQVMTLEERLKAEFKPLRAGLSSKTLRKANGPVVRRTGPRRKDDREQGKQAVGKIKLAVEQINAADLRITSVEVDQPPVPNLAYGLERVLFNPGVYHLQDPRSRVYNFDPYLSTIMPTSEFDFSALKEYITSSRDQALISMAKEHGKRYVGSTSSMSGVLTQFHFLLSQWRKINTSMISRGFRDKLDTFTTFQRSPTAVFLRWKDGTYAMDADKEFDSSTILSFLGKSMEKLITLKTEDFERYRKSNSEQVPEEERNRRESFHYSTMGDLLMRSQLDAYDPRLPGTGMFDLKTRAVFPVRMNVVNPTEGSGYEIQGRLGEWESFEREYFDMIRSAFLKYSLQVRMGRMDGIFVAFHNIKRIFGFQYISLEEMDLALHGHNDRTTGDQEFKLSLDLLNTILNKVTERFPKQSIRLHFETRDTSTNFMYIFAEPVTEEQAEEIQSMNKEAIEELECELLGLSKKDEDEADHWDEIQAKVEEAMDKDERGMEEDEEGDDDIAHATLEFKDGQAKAEEVVPYEEGEGESDADTGADLTNGVVKDDAGEINEEELEDEDEDVEESEDGELEGTEEDVRLLGVREGVEHVAEDKVVHKTYDVEEAQDEAEAEGYENEKDNANSEETLVEDSHPKRSGIEELVPDSTTDQSSGSPQHTLSTSEALPAQEQTSEFDSVTDPTLLDDLTKETATSVSESPILAMTLTIRNKVDGKYILRPTNLTSTPSSSPYPYPTPVQTEWSVEYTLAEVKNLDRARALYNACKTRRQGQNEKNEMANQEEDSAFRRLMKELVAMGEKYRKVVDEREAGMKKVVLGWDVGKGEGRKVEGVVAKGAEGEDESGGIE